MSCLATEPEGASALRFTSQTPDGARVRGLPPPEAKTPVRVVSYVGQPSLLDGNTHNSHGSPSRQLLHSPFSPQHNNTRLNPLNPQPRDYQRVVVTPTGKAVYAPLGSPIRVAPPTRSRLGPEYAPFPPPHPGSQDQRIELTSLRRPHLSDPGRPLTSVRPAQFLYYHQVPGPDHHGPPIAWNTRELVMRSPPLPRQRSARACKKCRKRKTKCSGAIPCTRCKNRGLDCEYDERALMRGNAASTSEDQTAGARPSTSDGVRPTHPRPSSRGVYRHQPYPPTRSPFKPASTATASPIVRASSAPEFSGTASPVRRPAMQLSGPPPPLGQHSESYVLHTLGPSPPPGFPNGPLEPWMEMSTMVENYPSVWTAPLGGGSVQGWNSAVNGHASEASDNSRPGSSCSGSSNNSSVGSVSVERGQPTMWPLTVPVAPAFEMSVPSPVSPSSSSSSLDGALTELHRAPRYLHPESADLNRSGPLITGYTNSDDLGLRDPQSSPMPASRSHQNVTSILRDVFTVDDYTYTPGKETYQISPSPSMNLKFEDFFNFSPDAPRLIASSNGCVAASPGGGYRTPAKSGSAHHSLARLTDYGSSPPVEMKTPRMSHTSPFDTLTNILSPQLDTSF